MIYKFCYKINDNYLIHTCTTLREAEIFFDILISANVDYIRVVTFKKQRS